MKEDEKSFEKLRKKYAPVKKENHIYTAKEIDQMEKEQLDIDIQGEMDDENKGFRLTGWKRFYKK